MILSRPVVAICPAGVLLGDLAQVAVFDGKGDAGQLAQHLAGDIGDVLVSVPLAAEQILCAVADELRSRGMTDKLAKLEELVRVIKAGQNRLIIGRFELNVGNAPTLEQIDAALEQQRRNVKAIVERTVRGGK